MKLYITYDLPQTTNVSDAGKSEPGAQEIQPKGQLVRWEVGEFTVPSGTRVTGVKLHFRPGQVSAGEVTQVVELPSHASNVHVHEGVIPSEYRSALRTAA